MSKGCGHALVKCPYSGYEEVSSACEGGVGWGKAQKKLECQAEGIELYRKQCERWTWGLRVFRFWNCVL